MKSVEMEFDGAANVASENWYQACWDPGIVVNLLVVNGPVAMGVFMKIYSLE